MHNETTGTTGSNRSYKSIKPPPSTPQSYGQPPYQSRGAITPPKRGSGGELVARGDKINGTQECDRCRCEAMILKP